MRGSAASGAARGLRAALIAGCVLAALLCLGFVLAGATAALAERFGLIEALAIMAVGALVAAPAAAERARARGPPAPAGRREAGRPRPPALIARRRFRWSPPMPHRAPLVGLGLVALGALMVLLRRDLRLRRGLSGAQGSPRTTRVAASCWSRWGAWRKADLDALTARFDAKVAAGGPAPNLVIQSPSFPTWSNFAALHGAPEVHPRPPPPDREGGAGLGHPRAGRRPADRPALRLRPPAPFLRRTSSTRRSTGWRCAATRRRTWS